MRANPEVNTEILAQSLKSEGVLIEPGHPFFTDETPPKNFYRLGYSSIPSERIPEGVSRIARALGQR
jgi:GntR family transcriptional regulator/MocR family aminotransferase